MYCEAADHFTQYFKLDPTVDPHQAVPSPAVAGKGVRFRFKLSKVGRVGIVVRHGGGPTCPRARRSSTESATSAGCLRA